MMAAIHWAFSKTPPKAAYLAMTDNPEEAEALHEVATAYAKLSDDNDNV